MSKMMKTILKIVAAALAVAAVACVLLTQWDKITSAVNRVAAKICPAKRESELDFYDEEQDGVYFKVD